MMTHIRIIARILRYPSTLPSIHSNILLTSFKPARSGLGPEPEPEPEPEPGPGTDAGAGADADPDTDVIGRAGGGGVSVEFDDCADMNE